MSGTASRNQTRLTYAPGLRIGAYPGQMPSGSQVPVPGTAAPPAVPGVVPVSAAPQASGGGVMSGSVRDRERDPSLPGSGSEGGMSDPSAVSGVASTGSFLSDLAGFGRAAGPMAAGVALGGPLGVLSGALGLFGLGVANAFSPQTAMDIASAIGLDTVQDEIGIGPNTPASEIGGLKSETVSDVAEGAPANDGNSPGGTASDNANSNSTAEGQSAAGNDGTGAGGAGTGAGAPGNDSSDFMRGGYTGYGRDGVVQADKAAGTVHEGEVVIPASQVARYGLDPLMMLARGQVQPSRLMALLRG